AFVGFRSDTFPGGLTVMNADGTGLRQVADAGGGPAWQPVPCPSSSSLCASLGTSHAPVPVSGRGSCRSRLASERRTAVERERVSVIHPLRAPTPVAPRHT